jgi:hypothetical protein
MGVKQLKQIKEDLTNKLQDKVKELIIGPEVVVTISDDLERIMINLTTTRNNKESMVTTYTENLLIYNTKDKNNMVFQGYGKNVIYKNNIVSGFSADYGQIDLTTLYMLQQFLYTFCLENELIEPQEESNKTKTEKGMVESDEE